MKFISLKEVFDHHFQDVEYDVAFCKKVEHFVKSFLSKNDAHVSFFGGNLLGVHPVRWNYSDTDYWWDEIYDVDDTVLQKDLNTLPDIKTNRVISSDVLNHAFIYSLYRVHNSPFIPNDLKEKTKVRLMLSLNFKFICSLMAHYFKYNADESIAIKTYNSLTKQFDLKTTGSWGKMLLARSEAFVEENGRYYQAYTKYDDDIEIIKMLNDAQGRIRETVKKITRIYYEMMEAEARVLSTSATVEVDGTKLLKDIERARPKYIRYIKSTITEKDGYFKDELQYLIFKAIPSLQSGVYEQIQKTFIDNYTQQKHSRVLNQLIDDILTFSFDLLDDNDIKLNDLPGILYRLKHVFMSGRIKDETLENAKSGFDKLVVLTDRRLKNQPLVPERCGFFLYLVIRTITMNYYK